MRALDLFCGAGGVTKGLQRAGFYVTGVDIKKQPRYCGDHFIQGDALGLSPLVLKSFDFVWASPPCQAHTAMRTMFNAREHVSLISETRKILKTAGGLYTIENVVGAPLLKPFMLCGTSFGLGVRNADLYRHRLFETNFPVIAMSCHHSRAHVLGVYGGHVRNRKRAAGCTDKGCFDFSTKDAQIALGIDWMTLTEMCQSIPPAYSAFIGDAARKALSEIAH